MELSPRWRKILTDLWGNKARSILVVLSIAVGVFAVGFVSSSFTIILDDMDKTYKASNAFEALLITDPITDDAVTAIRKTAGVEDAEARSSVNGKVYIDPKKELQAGVTSIPKISDMRIDLIQAIDPPIIPELKDNQVYLERSALSEMPVKVGDTINFEISNTEVKKLTVVAIILDSNSPPYLFTNQISLYANQQTVENLGGPAEPNTVYITVTGVKTDEAHVREVARVVGDKIQKGGARVYTTLVISPGRHWASDITKALGEIMGILGVLSVILSTFLVINTINTLISQQIRQIGIMRAIGGGRYQVVWMYLTLVGIYGVIALIVALPLAAITSFALAQFIAKFLNFNIMGFRIPTLSLLLQIMVAVVIPIVAAIVPVLSGSRVVIREALSDYGLSKGKFGRSQFDKLLERIRFFSRPVLISLRNTFRRKTRLIMTLSTLTLAGAIFIAVFNLKAAFKTTIDQTLGYFIADVTIDFNKTYRYEQLKPLLFSVPGVVDVENWGFTYAQLLNPQDQKTSTQVMMIAPPSTSTMIQPSMTGGRWLVQGDENAIVVGNHLLKVRPDLKIGETVTLEINNKKYPWVIVGTFKLAGNMPDPPVYANAEYLAKLTNQVSSVSTLRVKTDPHNQVTQDKIAAALTQVFKQKGIDTGAVQTAASIQASNASSTNVLVYFLLIMSVLIALVGGLGLSGTMSMNVLERTREIGVMRSIGAENNDILGIVITEGMIIGLISWILGSILALPISYLLDLVVGNAFVGSPLNFTFSTDGLIIWLIGILVITTIASFLPARNASRLTVREVLAYE
jgi:putative ABC transport system permease protein